MIAFLIRFLRRIILIGTTVLIAIIISYEQCLVSQNNEQERMFNFYTIWWSDKNGLQLVYYIDIVTLRYLFSFLSNRQSQRQLDNNYKTNDYTLYRKRRFPAFLKTFQIPNRINVDFGLIRSTFSQWAIQLSAILRWIITN